MNNPLPHQRCPLCGGANQCTPAATGHFDGECWCTQVIVSPEALQRLPPDQIDQACLCPRCAAGVEDRG
ncbi:MAG TPA: cysteine-rich CWC family protein [Pseudomonas sp.]|jgi:hypothetical protein|nr:cysteine-rich CWC family protein [Pseudomonas sp.]